MFLSKLKNLLRKLLLNGAKGNIDISQNKAYLNSKNIDYQYFEENQELNLHRATLINQEKPIEALSPFNSHLEGYFLSIQNHKFRFSNNHLLDDKLNVIYHLGFPFEKMPISKQLLPRKVKKLNGEIAYLSNTATNHYGHWLRHILPLLYIYKKYIDLDKIDYFYIGDIAKPAKFIYETFDILNIPKEKIIHQPCTSSKLIHIVMCWKPQNDNQSYLPQPLFEFVRNLFLDKVKVDNLKDYPKKIYIQRGKVQWRQVLNENELTSFLKDEGFTIFSMDNLSILEQVKVFYNAEKIIAPHGSALANLFFIKPKTKVLEIMPYNYICKNNYERTAHVNGKYFFFKGEKVNTDVEPCYEDILVDINTLKEIVFQFFSN